MPQFHNQLVSKTVWIPDGDAGTHDTVNWMRAYSRGSEGAKNPYLHQQARWIVHPLPERDQESEAHALAGWMRSHVRFSNEFEENLQDPMVTLGWTGYEFDPQQSGGDCDCLSTALSALLWTLGIRNRFVAVATDPNKPNKLNHVMVLAHDKRTGRWFPLDPSRGECSGTYYRTVVYGENGGRQEQQGLGCDDTPDCGCRAQTLGEGSDDTSLSGIGSIFGAIAGGIGTAAKDVGGFVGSSGGQALFQDVLGPIAQGYATHIAYGPGATLNSVTASGGSPFQPQAAGAPQQQVIGSGSIFGSTTPTWLPWVLVAVAAFLVTKTGEER